MIVLYTHKMQTHIPIKLKLDTHKGFNIVHLCTSFGWNPIKIYIVMIDFSCKKGQRSGVNRWKKSFETWHVDGVIIIGVPFC